MASDQTNLTKNVFGYFYGTQAAIEALTGVPEGALAWGWTTLPSDGTMGYYDGTNWIWLSAGGGSFPNPFALPANITPAAITGNVNNYNPTGGATADVWRLSTNGNPWIITGIAGGTNGRILILQNIDADWEFTLADNSGASDAENRFALGGHPVYLNPGSLIVLLYDNTLQKWKEVAGHDAENLHGVPIDEAIDSMSGMLYIDIDGKIKAREVFDDSEGQPAAIGAAADGSSDFAARRDHVHEGTPVDGWIAGTGTWSYSSADDPVFVASVPDADAAKMNVGDRWKITQTSVKYFIIVAKGSPSGGFTPVTIYGGTDYDLANAAIASPYFAHVKSPLGFPLSPAKWTVQLSDTAARSQATPTQNTWYNPGSLSISIPIGIWKVDYFINMSSNGNVAPVNCFGTLSTANNSESDVDFTTFVAIFFPSANANNTCYAPSSKAKTLELATKTSYYLNIKTSGTGISSIRINGDLSKTFVRAVCAYL